MLLIDFPEIKDVITEWGETVYLVNLTKTPGDRALGIPANLTPERKEIIGYVSTFSGVQNHTEQGVVDTSSHTAWICGDQVVEEDFKTYRYFEWQNRLYTFQVDTPPITHRKTIMMWQLKLKEHQDAKITSSLQPDRLIE